MKDLIYMKNKKRFIPDYHWTLRKGMNKEERKKANCGDVWINAAVCVKCKDYSRSLNVHDYRRCKCGAIAVAEGSWYCKRSGNPEDMINVIEMFEEDKYDE